MPKVKHHSKRRVEPLKDADYDHEINLTDSALAQPDADAAADEDADADADTDSQQQHGRQGSNTAGLASVGYDGIGDHDDEQPAGGAVATADGPGQQDAALLSIPTTTTDGLLSPTTSAAESSAPLLPSRSNATAASVDTHRGRSPPRPRKSMRFDDATRIISTASDGAPSVAIQRSATEPAFEGEHSEHTGQTLHVPSSRKHPPAPESTIDVLYENERGAFLCGIPLFSGRALGNLDPSPWTNAAQKTSITDINTAQVPDPSWVWAWPDWRVYHDAGHTDEDGWEYSFMFAKCFSWHGPTWYNSFVRRRVWIRKRVKRQPDDAAASAAASSMGLSEGDSSVLNPQLLNPDYFVVLPAAAARRSASRATSRASSRASSRVSWRGSLAAAGSSQAFNDAASEVLSEISNADVLLSVLRGASIDRERLNAVQSFLEHGSEDLAKLPGMMHEIMALFVFQASRRILVTRLTTAHGALVQLLQESTTEEAAGAKPETQPAQPGTQPEAGLAEPKVQSGAQPEGRREAHAETQTEEQGTQTATQAPAEEHTADATAAEGGKDEKGKGKGKASIAANGTAASATAEKNKPVLDEHEREEIGRRVAFLSAALKHAGEEVRRFEFWSDIKAVAQDEESLIVDTDPVDCSEVLPLPSELPVCT